MRLNLIDFVTFILLLWCLAPASDFVDSLKQQTGDSGNAHTFARSRTHIKWFFIVLHTEQARQCSDVAMVRCYMHECMMCVCVCLRPLQIWKWTANRLCIKAHRWRRRWHCAVCTQRRSRLAVLSTVECTTELPTNHIYYTQPLLRSALCIVKANAAQHSKECIDDADVVRWQCDSLLPSRIGHTQHV